MAATLERAQEAALAGDQVTVTFAAGERYSGTRVSGEPRAVAAAASAAVGRPVNVNVAYRDAREQPQPGAAAADSDDVARVLKIFRGEVVKENSYGT